MEERVIEVSREFYVQLTQYLQPDERWAKKIDDERHALVLFTRTGKPGPGLIGWEEKSLIFVPR